jgi:hypothetical protein
MSLMMEQLKSAAYRDIWTGIPLLAVSDFRLVR